MLGWLDEFAKLYMVKGQTKIKYHEVIITGQKNNTVLSTEGRMGKHRMSSSEVMNKRKSAWNQRKTEMVAWKKR